MAREHTYSKVGSKITKEIKRDVKNSTIQGIDEGFIDAFNKEIKNFPNIKIDEKQLANIVKNGVSNAISSGIKNVKVNNIDMSELLVLDQKSLLKELEELYENLTPAKAKKILAAKSIYDLKGYDAKNFDFVVKELDFVKKESKLSENEISRFTEFVKDNEIVIFELLNKIMEEAINKPDIFIKQTNNTRDFSHEMNWCE